MIRVLGIRREAQNSPGREDDDAMILKAVLAQMARRRVDTELAGPQAVDEGRLEDWDLIFPMCEAYPRLRRLLEFSKASPSLIINHPGAVLGCYRAQLLETLSRTPGVLVPESETCKLSASARDPASGFGAAGFWIKRGDVHNTCDKDVVFVRGAEDAAAAFEDFRRREITSVVLQRHVDGDLIKFYGAGPGLWFTWFYHDPQTARKLPFEPEDLAQQAMAAANAVGVEVFGGDAVVSPGGAVYLLDLNSWPSFARVRDEAAVQISRWALSRLRLKKPGILP
ncbi:MAG: hypothetical protein ACYCPQ_02490 [Elusimicrobiota bacterium]